MRQKKPRKKGKRTCSEDGAWLRRRRPVDMHGLCEGVWLADDAWVERAAVCRTATVRPARPLAVRERAMLQHARYEHSIERLFIRDLGAVRRRARWPMEEGAAESVTAAKGERLRWRVEGAGMDRGQDGGE
jgi:hypothetical protein